MKHPASCVKNTRKKIIHAQLTCRLKSKHFLCIRQLGNHPLHSTYTALQEIADTAYRAMAEGNIMTQFAEANTANGKRTSELQRFVQVEYLKMFLYDRTNTRKYYKLPAFTPIFLNTEILAPCSSYRNLGATLDANLDWSTHII
ncbi:hypothetical protein PR048_030862 [Dryococelus australis]|uniref:Uncharacterized protein n=1 Tax=Dryococelus australis TaxID=614101 RepID=A0ABQ9GA31_9NEOP|nr:hypothetical protein PR048_030862 [Dryococelus australis]